MNKWYNDKNISKKAWSSMLVKKTTEQNFRKISLKRGKKYLATLRGKFCY